MQEKKYLDSTGVELLKQYVDEETELDYASDSDIANIITGEEGDTPLDTKGFAGGAGASIIDENGNRIEAIQLGSGMNMEENTLKVYDYKLLNANGTIPRERLQDDFYIVNFTITGVDAEGYISSATADKLGSEVLAAIQNNKKIIGYCATESGTAIIEYSAYQNGVFIQYQTFVDKIHYILTQATNSYEVNVSYIIPLGVNSEDDIDGFIYGYNRRISCVANPTSDQDAVNLQYMRNYVSESLNNISLNPENVVLTVYYEPMDGSYYYLSTHTYEQIIQAYDKGLEVTLNFESGDLEDYGYTLPINCQVEYNLSTVDRNNLKLYFIHNDSSLTTRYWICENNNWYFESKTIVNSYDALNNKPFNIRNIVIDLNEESINYDNYYILGEYVIYHIKKITSWGVLPDDEILISSMWSEDQYYAEQILISSSGGFQKRSGSGPSSTEIEWSSWLIYSTNSDLNALRTELKNYTDSAIGEALEADY